jgi:protein gp37
MSDNSKIEWTDATWNPVRGCTKISPGCLHCYAETFAERFRGVPGHPFEFGFDLRLVPEKLGDPIRWSKPKVGSERGEPETWLATYCKAAQRKPSRGVFVR